MKRDNRLSGVLHLLLHMAEEDRPLTSDILAGAMQTNPVVIRRSLSGLREHGIVRSEKGHGGGWQLTRRLEDITLADVYAALGAPALFAIGNRNETPDCLVEQAVNTALDSALNQAEETLLASFKALSLETLRSDFQHRLGSHSKVCRIELAHD